MNILVIIPIHNYIDGVRRLVSFAESELPPRCSDWRVVLVDNLSSGEVASELRDMGQRDKFAYIHQPVRKNLTASFQAGWSAGCDGFLPDAVMVWETDAGPRVDTLEAMLDVYREERAANVAVGSVSAMYRWKRRSCYPVARHWTRDPVHRKHDWHGVIRKTHAVPFVFSLWSPEAFALMSDAESRKWCRFMQLCRDFGRHVASRGMLHLRLCGYHTVHEGGGRRSRRNR